MYVPVESLQDPIERVADSWAEDAEDEEDDGDFCEANGGAVDDVGIIRKLQFSDVIGRFDGGRKGRTLYCHCISFSVTFHWCTPPFALTTWKTMADQTQ